MLLLMIVIILTIIGIVSNLEKDFFEKTKYRHFKGAENSKIEITKDNIINKYTYPD